MMTNTRRPSNVDVILATHTDVGLILVHRLGHWPNIKPTLLRPRPNIDPTLIQSEKYSDLTGRHRFLNIAD